MSNPAVLTLASLSDVKFPYRFEIEDNIGEAIHIHYKEFRFDLTIDEFYRLADGIENSFNQLVGVDGFDHRDYDVISLMNKAENLVDLEKVTLEEIYLKDILIDTYDNQGNQIFDSIEKSRVFKALNGLPSENNAHFEMNYYKTGNCEKFSNEERLLFVLQQIKENGYPINGELITFFNNENIIRDGQHRACCLFYLYGNIKVPVRRLHFKDKSAVSAVHENKKNFSKNITTKNVHLFPFELVEKGAQIILYGGGDVCHEFLDQINTTKWCEVLFIIDKNFRNCRKTIEPIFGIDMLQNDLNYDKIVISIEDMETVHEVEENLIRMGVKKQKILSMWSRTE